MKKAAAKSFNEGQLVFAKVRGYPPWPARVMSVAAGGQRCQVYFYGTNETGTVKSVRYCQRALCVSITAQLYFLSLENRLTVFVSRYSNETLQLKLII